jgi:hypothetical protein
MVTLDIANSRMKDFFDVFTLSQTFEFDGPRFAEAIRATFDRRETGVPQTPPLAMTKEFAHDPVKASQWEAFLRKHGLDSRLYELELVITQIRVFIMPVFDAINHGARFQYHWKSDQNWQSIGQ